MSDTPKRKPGSLFKRALFNQYNYIMLGSAGLFSVVSGSWLPALIGGAAEVLWLVLGADTDAFRRWAAKQDAAEAKQLLRAEISALVKTLDDHYVERFDALTRLYGEIQSLARDNKGLETALIADEMAKLETLLHSFLKMASGHQRLAYYLQENPLADVESEIAETQRALKRETDRRVQHSLKQALSLAQKRLTKHEQIEGACKALNVQMGTLEKAFDYLKSHILGIGRPEELAEALDDLVTGVASVSELESSTAELTAEPAAVTTARAAAQRAGTTVKN